MSTECTHLDIPQTGGSLENFTHLGHTIAFSVNDFRGGPGEGQLLIVTNDPAHLVASLSVQAGSEKALFDILSLIAETFPVYKELLQQSKYKDGRAEK